MEETFPARHRAVRACSAAISAGIALLLAGCSPSAFQRDADRQVQALIKDRQQTALGYTPNTDVGVPGDAYKAPPRKVYAAIPTTAIPPISAEPVVLRRIIRQASPLGPVYREPSLLDQLPTDDGINRAGAYVAEGYRLGPPIELGRMQRFSLFDCLHYATNHSRDYQGRVERLYGSALDVTLQRHLFTPRPFANIRTRYDGGQASSNYRSALTVAGQVGVRQRLPWGGELTASAIVNFVDALNANTADGEDARLAISGSLPLLRGAGLVNLESLISSERQLIYAVREFESYRRDFAIQVADRYFRLITSQQALRNRYLRYLSAIDLTARTEALFSSGTVGQLEVQRSISSLLQAEDGVNRAVQSYENALDDFKLLIGMPVQDDLAVVPIAIDVADPDLDIDRMTLTALRYRLDLQTARDRVEDARRGLEIAKNGLLPDLGLSFGSSLRNPSNTNASQLNSDTIDYSAELTLDLPLDRLAERNRLRSSLISLQSAQRGVIDVEQAILADMRQAARAIRSAQTSLNLQRRGIEIERQRLEFANISLLLGKTTDSRNVVEAQNSLLQAQDSYEQARADLQIQVLQLLRDTGQLRLDESSGQLGLALRREPEASESP